MSRFTITCARQPFSGFGPAPAAIDSRRASSMRYRRELPGNRTRSFGSVRYVAITMIALVLSGATCVVWPSPASWANTSRDHPERVEIGSFSASLFKFKKTQEDDGVGLGWQETEPTLKFADGRQDPPTTWSCTINVGMPLRTVKMGKIEASWAADATAEIATTASSAVMHSKDSWAPAAFCKTFKDQMNALFGKSFPNLGARVTYIK